MATTDLCLDWLLADGEAAVKRIVNAVYLKNCR